MMKRALGCLGVEGRGGKNGHAPYFGRGMKVDDGWGGLVENYRVSK